MSRLNTHRNFEIQKAQGPGTHVPGPSICKNLVEFRRARRNKMRTCFVWGRVPQAKHFASCKCGICAPMAHKLCAHRTKAFSNANPATRFAFESVSKNFLTRSRAGYTCPRPFCRISGCGRIKAPASGAAGRRLCIVLSKRRRSAKHGCGAPGTRRTRHFAGRDITRMALRVRPGTLAAIFFPDGPRSVGAQTDMEKDCGRHCDLLNLVCPPVRHLRAEKFSGKIFTRRCRAAKTVL